MKELTFTADYTIQITEDDASPTAPAVLETLTEAIKDALDELDATAVGITDVQEEKD